MLPLNEIPSDVFIKNNRSALNNPDFIVKEIQSLLNKGIISESKSQPSVINPLVAENKSGKKRIVLDCRHINPCLHKFKVKFEDIRVALDLFNMNSYIFTYDLKSAYHHIDIFEGHRYFLGFSWIHKGCRKFYVFNSFPFGIANGWAHFHKNVKNRCKILEI